MPLLVKGTNFAAHGLSSMDAISAATTSDQSNSIRYQTINRHNSQSTDTSVAKCLASSGSFFT